ncbi:MAG: sulfite exporter TauE/SafE family protein [Eubacteriales bacterium]
MPPNSLRNGLIKMEIILFLVAIFASTIGAISGMGGGVIIKPVMDAVSGLGASTISFMSCCTVLTMALVTYLRSIQSDIDLNYRTVIPLAIGGAIGGIAGKSMFAVVENSGNAALIQAAMLLAVNIGVLLYVLNKSRIKRKELKAMIPSFMIGLVLGGASSFLGIGGGPINIAVISYFYSMPPKETAKHSLFIILFSQLTSLGATVFSGLPEFNPVALGLMCVGGVLGAVIGKQCSKMLSERSVERLFTIVLIGLIALGCYNVYTFSGCSYFESVWV